MATLPRPNLIAFIDESGDFELNKINPHYPVCAQCALTSTVSEYLAQAIPNMAKVKYEFWGHETIIFHGQKIRKRSPPFDIFIDADVREEFHDAMAWAIGALHGCLIVSAVHKQRHIDTYLNPYDPFYLSLKFLLERLYMHWSPQLSETNRLLCVFEARGKKEDQKTLQWFEQICQGDNHTHSSFPFLYDFRPKSANVAGHQYADLAAYAACKFVDTGDDSRRDWQAVKGKLRRVRGQFQTHGLKIFPE